MIHNNIQGFFKKTATYTDLSDLYRPMLTYHFLLYNSLIFCFLGLIGRIGRHFLDLCGLLFFLKHPPTGIFFIFGVWNMILYEIVLLLSGLF